MQRIMLPVKFENSYVNSSRLRFSFSSYQFSEDDLELKNLRHIDRN